MTSVVGALLFAALVLHPQAAGAGERLVYAVVHKASDYAAAKTEIHSLDPETAETRIIFSDGTISIALIQHLYVFHYPAVGGGKLFAHAAERGKPVPFPGNGSLYELSGDGSNRARRVCRVLGSESLGDVFVNSDGTRLGYINRLDKRQYIFIHDVATGALVAQVDITDRFLDCFASSMGWVPGTETLYFSLETVDDDATSKASYDRAGSYLMSIRKVPFRMERPAISSQRSAQPTEGSPFLAESRWLTAESIRPDSPFPDGHYPMDERGGRLEKLPPIPAAKGFFPQDATRIVGVLPTGDYLFETSRFGKRSSRGVALWKVHKDSWRVEDISFRQAAPLYSGARIGYELSPSGKYLSAARAAVSSSAVSWDIWLKNLDTGTERKILSLPTDGLKGPFLGLVGWINN